MGTRSGDLDPAIILDLIEKRKMSPEEVKKVIYKKSGVEGISGVSMDLREIQAASAEGNERATLSVELLCYSILKYIGSFTAVMNGVDGIIFTAGIGENDHIIREKVSENLTYLGVEFDKEKNARVRGTKEMLTKDSSKVKVMLIPTNEELMIAQDTMKLIS